MEEDHGLMLVVMKIFNECNLENLANKIQWEEKCAGPDKTYEFHNFRLPLHDKKGEKVGEIELWREYERGDYYYCGAIKYQGDIWKKKPDIIIDILKGLGLVPKDLEPFVNDRERDFKHYEEEKKKIKVDRDGKIVWRELDRFTREEKPEKPIDPPPYWDEY